MKMYDFQFVTDAGMITYICASCKTQAIIAFCEQTNIPEDWVKEHCIIRNKGVVKNAW